MNIQEAKNQVKYSVISYLSKDEFGEYLIPVERQRPLFLVGPPGIGKTEIMAQVAAEMDIALVNYSMTHHTRQSALGLPYIKEQSYDGKEYRTTEYTMSEIIASVHDVMEDTGKREGILFLDEINCISETLAPSMLQFLQFKVFGRHQVPEGWVVITAGNPPEYNNSVRDFDLATMDRLKRLDIEPDLGVWQKYAQNERVHSSVLSYLSIKKDDFYAVRTTVDGKQFVTARGWVDLSEMIFLYEKNDLPVDNDLIRQYIHDERIARDFSAYYELFYRYKKEYDIADILEGKASEEVKKKAMDAPFDERITIIRLLNDALSSDFRKAHEMASLSKKLFEIVKENRDILVGADFAVAAALMQKLLDERREAFRRKKAAHSLSRSETRVCQNVFSALEAIVSALHHAGAETSAVDVIRGYLADKNDERKAFASATSLRLGNVFRFLEEAFDDNEMLIFVTTLTEDKRSAEFIAQYGSDDYYRHNKGLLLYEREQDLMDEIRGSMEELEADALAEDMEK